MTTHAALRRRLAFRLWAAVHLAAGLLGVSAFWPEAAAAAADLHEQLPGPVWVWSDVQEYDLPGARIRVRRFQASVAPADAARRLAASAPRFTRLQLLGSSLWLSGLQDDEHWMAHLRRHAGGTAGLVSSLVPQAGSQVPWAGVRALVPCPASRVIRMSSREPASAVLLHVACPGSANDVQRQLGRRLRAARWQPAEGSGSESADGTGDWRHPSGALLTILSQVRASEVWLTFWHRAPESRS